MAGPGQQQMLRFAQPDPAMDGRLFLTFFARDDKVLKTTRHQAPARRQNSREPLITPEHDWCGKMLLDNLTRERFNNS
jgi:hypothetical protein